MDQKQLDDLSIATIRSLCIDEINKANSGHPGMALGSAPILYTLFTRYLVANPFDTNFFNRDRFVLSSGHASALLYALLHVSGYPLSIDDLKSFRQLGSLTPGHPEYGHTPGVDATSGPLGQGIAQAVGIAMAERAVQGQYKDGELLCNHYTYCLCGDGCLQEGLSQEAISLAGHQKLNKLILFYDSNNVTLDGGIDLSFSEDVKKRFLASEWNVINVENGNDVEAISKAIKKAKKSLDKPTLIIVKTIIGFGSQKQGTNKVHGSPLGSEDGKKAKLSYHFDHEDFYVPDEVYQNFKDTFIKRGLKMYRKYNRGLKEYKKNNPHEYDIFMKAIKGDTKSFAFNSDPLFETTNKDSSRVSSGKILNQLHHEIPFLMGGSADVAGSVMTKIDGGVNFSKEHPEGRNINFGIREFAMASAQNGMLLHRGLKTYIGSFLVFSDYMKSAIRMSALSNLPAIYLFSHDSVALGEDGPTHQPIEHLAMLRSIPGVNVIRPCDARETYASWKIALESKHTPNCLILSRQNLPLLDSKFDEVSKGAYIISKEEGKLDAIIIATGSEVSLAIEAQKLLKEQNINVRVVSMPSTYLFEKQNEEYKHKILPLNKEKIFAVEMLSSFGWYKYADNVMSIDTFGESAPTKDVIAKFDFNENHLVKLVLSKLRG